VMVMLSLWWKEDPGEGRDPFFIAATFAWEYLSLLAPRP